MTINKIIIVGAGGHAAELTDYLNYTNNIKRLYEIMGYIDDDKNIYSQYKYDSAYLGDIKNHEVKKDAKYLLAIANLKYRRNIAAALLTKGAKFISFIHPTAIISPSAIIDEGTVVSHNSSVGPNAKIGKFNLLNSRCTIGHDTTIGEFNFISPQTAISGHTKIGNDNLFGTNSATIPSISVGNNNTIAAGMVIFKDVDNDNIVIPRYKESIVSKKDV